MTENDEHAFVEANWIAAERSSGRHKPRGTANAPSYETFSADSSIGAPSPSTERHCLTNNGATRIKAADFRRRATKLHGHLGAWCLSLF